MVFIFKFSGFAQSTEFFKTYDIGYDAFPVLGHLHEYNNSIYLNGTISDYNQKILIIKVSQNGLLTNTNIIGTDTVNYYPNNFLQISNIVFLSGCTNGSPPVMITLLNFSVNDSDINFSKKPVTINLPVLLSAFA